MSIINFPALTSDTMFGIRIKKGETYSFESDYSLDTQVFLHENISNNDITDDSYERHGSYESFEALLATVPTDIPADPGPADPESGTVTADSTIATYKNIAFTTCPGYPTELRNPFQTTHAMYDAFNSNLRAGDFLDENWRTTFYTSENNKNCPTCYIDSVLPNKSAVYKTGDLILTGGGVSSGEWRYRGWYETYPDGHIEISEGGWRFFYRYTYTPYTYERFDTQSWTRCWSMLVYKRPPYYYEGNNGRYYLAAWTTTTDENGVMTNSDLEQVPLAIYPDRIIVWPPPDGNRKDDPDGEEDFFDPEEQDWTDEPTDLTTLGGGRYRQHLVVVGHKKVYFGPT